MVHICHKDARNVVANAVRFFKRKKILFIEWLIRENCVFPQRSNHEQEQELPSAR